MNKYHINPETGNPGLCKASSGQCPFGTPEAHFPTKEEARNAYEKFRSIFSTEVVVEKPHKLPLDPEVLKLITDLSGDGARPLIVGGAVRDSLASGVAPKDVDIEVHNISSMEALLQVVKEKGYSVDEVGKSFGVLKTTLPSGLDIDLSVPRKDNLVGEGHRGFTVEVDPTLSLAEAAARRDFTINALYYDPTREVILDAHGGLEDWNNKTLRHVSDAFSEDPLRVLRAMQLASRFDLRLHPSTAAEAQRIEATYHQLSTERVQEEWQKLFKKSSSVEAGLKALRESGWDKHFSLHEVELTSTAIQTDATLRAARKHGLRSEVFGPAALAKQLPPNKRRDFLKTTVVSSRDANFAHRLSGMAGPKNSTPKEIKRWARAIAKEGATVEDWTVVNHAFTPPSTLHGISQVAKSENSFKAPQPDLITGQMILDESKEAKGGPWVGKLMRRAAEAQDDEVFTTQEEALTWLRKSLKASA